MSNMPLRRSIAAPARRAIALSAALALAGCAAAPTTPEDAPRTAARSLLSKAKFATQAVPPADFVKAQRRPPESLAYIPISTPRDEPRLKPADQPTIARRVAAAKALKPRRDALAANPPRLAPAPQLPASALEAKREHDERMRERASEAE
jgi:hypothetical protein